MTNIILGIVGGGQLGRMSAQAASKIGITTHIYCPEEDSPASQVSAKNFIGTYDDTEKLAEFAKSVDVISYEFENIPVQTVQFLKTIKPVYPDEQLLEISQDRISEKSFLNQIGIETTKWKSINSAADMAATFKEWDADEIIFKTTRFGYDGKGQIKASSSDNLDEAYKNMGGVPLIAEAIIDFDCEISVIVARDKDGKSVTYGPMLNEHRNHILHKTATPCGLAQDIQDKAINAALMLANKINLQGVLTVEYFVTKSGDVLANEIAPRTHNSGHWSIEGCAHSQFDNHVRAVCGMPVLEPDAKPTEMINLIGEDVHHLAQYPKDQGFVVHLYGKQDARPGRKMGHVTRLL